MKMKRFSALLLAVLLLMTSTCAYAEFAVSTVGGGSVTMVASGSDDEDQLFVNSVAAWDGALYAAGGSLYRVDPATGVPTPLSGDGYANNIAMDASGLYAFDGSKLYRITVTDDTYTMGEPIVDLTEDFNADADSYAYCQSMAMQDGKVYLLMQGFDPNYEKQQLWEVDPASGSARMVLFDALQSICAYQDGKLLALYQSWNGESYYPLIKTVDLASGEMETLYTMAKWSMGGLCYDAAADIIYIADDSMLYRYTAGAEEAETCAYLVMDNLSTQSCSALLNGRYYLVDNGSGKLASCDTDPANKPARALRISMSYKDETLRAFQQAYPDIPVELVSDDAYTIDQLTQSMVSGSAADIYTVGSSTGMLDSLVSKGYCADLSGSQAIADIIAQINPAFTAHYASEGHIWGVPQEASASTLLYSPSVLEKIGLTTDDLPTTWSEFLDFAQRWEDEFAEDYADLTLVQSYGANLGYLLSNMILSDNMTYYSSVGQDLAFDTPVMQGLLAKLGQMRGTMDALSPEQDQNGVVYYSDSGASSLFQLSSTASPSDYSYQDYKAWPLSLGDGYTPAVSLSVNLYMMNANCTAPDLAQTFLEFAATHMTPATKITLCPDANDPVENEYYAQNMKSFQSNIDDLNESIAAADDVNKRELEDTLKEVQSEMQTYEQDERWSISEEDIAAWRAIEPYVTVPDNSAFLSAGSTEIVNLLTRYSEGQLESTQFLKELDRIMRMIRMENS